MTWLSQLPLCQGFMCPACLQLWGVILSVAVRSLLRIVYSKLFTYWLPLLITWCNNFIVPENIHSLPIEGFFFVWLSPHLQKFQYSAILSFSPPWISVNYPWGWYGYFLELLVILYRFFCTIAQNYTLSCMFPLSVLPLFYGILGCHTREFSFTQNQHIICIQYVLTFLHPHLFFSWLSPFRS